MANSGPNTNASQFFITYSKQCDFDGKYTIFGKMIDGFEALERIEKEPVDSEYRPLNEIRIESIQIHSNPIADL